MMVQPVLLILALVRAVPEHLMNQEGHHVQADPATEDLTRAEGNTGLQRKTLHLNWEHLKGNIGDITQPFKEISTH